MININFDFNGIGKMLKGIFQRKSMPCLHCYFSESDSGWIATPAIASPPGTVLWRCDKCGEVFSSETIAKAAIRERLEFFLADRGIKVAQLVNLD